MTDRRSGGNGTGNGHYRGEGKSADPSENVKELVVLQAVRHAEGLAALALRLDQRDKIREIHRGELAKMAELIGLERTERLKAEAETETERVNAVIASDRAAVVLLATETKATAAAVAVQVETARKTSDAQIEASASALRATSEANTKGLTDRIEPLERVQFAAVGVKDQRAEGRQSNAAIYALIGLIITVLLFAMAVTTFVIARATP